MTDGNRWPATAALSAVTGGDQRRESDHARAITGGRGQKVLGRLTGGPVSKLTQPNFFQLIKFSSNWKFNLKALPSFKNTQTLHETRFEYFEHLSQLGQLPIPNIHHVINFGTDSNLNLL
jgi:hypothetical protein